MITFGTVTKGNADVPCNLTQHSKEEANTLMLLDAKSVNNGSVVIVLYPDTDVLIPFIQFHQSSPESIQCLSESQTIKLRPIVDTSRLSRQSQFLEKPKISVCEIIGAPTEEHTKRVSRLASSSLK